MPESSNVVVELRDVTIVSVGSQGPAGADGLDGATELGGLTDVALVGVISDGSSLIFDSATNTWVNKDSSELRQALGLEIGVNVQAYNSKLTNLGSLPTTLNSVIIADGTQWDSVSIVLLTDGGTF